MQFVDIPNKQAGTYPRYTTPTCFSRLRKRAGASLLIRTLLVNILVLVSTSVSSKESGTPVDVYQRQLDAALNGTTLGLFREGVMLKANWLADGNRFWYVAGAPENTAITLVNPVTRLKTPLLDTTRLRNSLHKALGKEPPHRGVPFEHFELLEDINAIRFTLEGRQYRCDLQSYAITPVPPPSEAEAAKAARLKPRPVPFLIGNMTQELLSPNQRWFAGTENFNLYLRDTHDDSITTLTTDGVEGLAWDIWNASPRWSPDSNRLAVTQVDSRHMDRMPVVDWLTDEAVTFLPWSKAGRPLWKAELFIFDVSSGKRLAIDTGSRDNVFLSVVDWLPDGSELLFLRIDREFKWADLMAADPVSGSVRKLFTETQNTQLNINAFESANTPLLDNGRQLLWLSERSGTAQLYLYENSGKLIRKLTWGNNPITQITYVDEERGWVYYMALGDKTSPYSAHLYRVNLEGGSAQRLTDGSGNRIIHISPSGDFFLDSYSGLTDPPRTGLFATDGQFISNLSATDMKQVRQHLPMPELEEFTAKAADGVTDLYGVILKPYNFDPAKKYPVVDHIYNGPHSRYLPMSMPQLLSNPEAALPHLGLIMLVFDGRGSQGRGKRFQDASYGRLGEVELADHVAVLQQLAKKRPWMDLDHVGIYGISYGGHMTLKAMFQRPDIYKVGVASAPLVDLAHGMAYTEHYMGLPENNPEGYDKGANTALVNHLQGKLLVIHATEDVNAPFSSTVKLIEALISANKRFDLMLLPDQPHVPYGDKLKYWLQLKHQYLRNHLLDLKMDASLP